MIKVDRTKLPTGWVEFSGNPVSGRLDADQERELFLYGDINEFLGHYIDFARVHALKNRHAQCFDTDTVVSESQAALMEASNDFDPKKGRFTTWIATKVDTRFYSLYRIGKDLPAENRTYEMRRGNQNLIPLDRVSLQPTRSGVEGIADKRSKPSLDIKIREKDWEYARASIRGIMSGLSSTQYVVLLNRVDALLKHERGQVTYEQLARSLGVTWQNIQGVMDRLVKKLANNPDGREAYEALNAS